jgi:Mg-chelatase subunit ChlD
MTDTFRKLVTTIAASCLAITIAAAQAAGGPPAKEPAQARIEVAFVLDTTGSMSGLIEGAKLKIWSIVNSVLATKPAPDIRIGLVAYRDRGDAYVTQLHDLTTDLDGVYQKLRGFQAQDGGDAPESVNQALHEAVNLMTWSEDRSILKMIFLVGDFPPHMDYPDDVKYPVTCEKAVKKDIIINTIQCGNESTTAPVWQNIARKSEGKYVQIAQSGGMVAIATPMDAELGRLAADLRGTVIYYGDADKRASAMKSGALAAEAPAAVTAERASVMNKMGRAETSGSDLVTMVRDGMTINEVRWEDLSPEISAMKPEERAKLLSKKVEERAAIQAKIDELARKREAFLREALTKTENKDAFDTVVNGIIRDQAAKKGIRY